MPYIGQPPVTGDTTKSFRLLDNLASFTLTFDATSSSVVDTSANTLTFANHRFVTAQRVTYTDGGGTAIGGLTDGTAYFVIKVDQNTIQLASSASNANNSTAISLSSGAAGGSHTLNLAFDGTNTKFKATYGNGTKAKISRAGQLLISINGVLQQAQESSSPTLGFGLDSDSTIVFSQAPVSTDVLFGQILADTITNFDTQDNTLDVFTGDGSTTAFTLSKKPASSNDILVTLDGVVQYPTTTSTSNAYSVSDNTLSFTAAPADGVSIQVRHIGFAGATSSAVTGLYGRTGNVTLSSSDDDITVGNVTAGIITATSYGSISGTTASFSGNVSIGGTLTYEDVTNIDAVGLITARSGISITGGNLTLPDAIIHDGDTNTRIRFPAVDTFTIETAGNERVRVGAAGSVGIGTNTPKSKLSVHGLSEEDVIHVSAGNTAGSTFANIRGDNEAGIRIRGGGSFDGGTIELAGGLRDSEPGIIKFSTGTGETVTERLRIDSSGRVLLGTTTEGETGADDLTIATSGATGITIRSGTSASGNLYFSDGTSGADEYRGYVQYNHSSNYLVLGTNASNRLFIDSSGRIGMGNDSPGSYSSVADDLVVGNHSGAHGITIAAENNNTAYLRFADGTANSGQQANGQIAYSHADLSMRFNVDASERMRIDSSGRLLIGSSTSRANGYGDNASLQLEGTSYPKAAISAILNSNNANGPSLNFAKTRGSNGSSTIVQDGDNLGVINFAGADGTDIKSAAARIRAQVDGTPGGNDMPGRIAFDTTADGSVSPVERMTINSSGNMGLGTASPTDHNSFTRIFDINGSGGGAVYCRTNGSSANVAIFGQSGSDVYVINKTAGNIRFNISDAEKVRIDSSGRLLIGATSARTKWNNSGSIGANILQVERAGNANAAAISITANSGTSSPANAVGSAARLLLGRTRGTSVGSNTGIANGDVLGDVSFQGMDGSEFVEAASIQAFVDGVPSANDMPGRLVFYTTANSAAAGSERMRITNTGIISIADAFSSVGTPSSGVANGGILIRPTTVQDNCPLVAETTTTSNSVALLFANPNGVRGSIVVQSSSTAYNTTSDYRLKENVIDLNGAIDRVKQLAPKRFNFINDEKTVDGFLAHEAATVVPESVTGTRDEIDDKGKPVYQGIDTSKLVPLLTAALQEAIAEIETLKTKVAALEG